MCLSFFYLRVKETLDGVCDFTAKGNNSYDFLYALLHSKPLLKMMFSIRKVFAPRGSKFLPYRVDPLFSMGPNNYDRAVSLKNISIHLKYIPKNRVFTHVQSANVKVGMRNT